MSLHARVPSEVLDRTALRTPGPLTMRTTGPLPPRSPPSRQPRGKLVRTATAKQPFASFQPRNTLFRPTPDAHVHNAPPEGTLGPRHRHHHSGTPAVFLIPSFSHLSKSSATTPPRGLSGAMCVNITSSVRNASLLCRNQLLIATESPIGMDRPPDSRAALSRPPGTPSRYGAWARST